MTRKNLKRRVQKTVATVTHTADNEAVISDLLKRVGTLNQLAAKNRTAIQMANINDHAPRLFEVQRLELLRKDHARCRAEWLQNGYKSLGNVPLNRRLPNGYEYQYLPIMRNDGTADEHNAEVWRKAVNGE